MSSQPKTIATAERNQRAGESRNNTKRIRDIDRQIDGLKTRAKRQIAAIKSVVTKEARGLQAERRDLMKRNQTLGERLAA